MLGTSRMPPFMVFSLCVAQGFFDEAAATVRFTSDDAHIVPFESVVEGNSLHVFGDCGYTSITPTELNKRTFFTSLEEVTYPSPISDLLRAQPLKKIGKLLPLPT